MRSFLRFIIVTALVMLLATTANGWRRRRRRRAPPPCQPVNCQPTNWQPWTQCTQSCGTGGVSSRSRAISRGAICGGSCPFPLQETRQCNRICCPVDCKLSIWSPWGQCSTSCGLNRKKSRTRTVTQQMQCGGISCEKTIEVKVCNDTCCPIDCRMSTWSSWGTCSRDCGMGGTQWRDRIMLAYEECGGNCDLTMEESRSCNNHCCPVDCKMTSWSSWGACSNECGNDGEQQRTRNITVEPQCNGTVCTNATDVRGCSRRCCQDNCHAVSWSAWSECACTGLQKRQAVMTSDRTCDVATCERHTEQRSCKAPECRNGVCVSTDSKCHCMPGYKGKNCNQTCEKGSFGLGCSLTCSCNTSTCDTITGKCHCEHDRFGDRCEKVVQCNSGYTCTTANSTVTSEIGCFLAETFTTTKLRCPDTHYAEKCLCAKDCQSASLTRSHTCQCFNKKRRRSVYYAGVVCCPMCGNQAVRRKRVQKALYVATVE